MAAHRLSTVKNADQILVMRNSGVWNSSGAAGKEGLLLRVGEESIIDGVKRRLISCNYSARNP